MSVVKGMPVVAAALLVLALAGCGDRVYDTGLVGAFTGGGPAPDAPSPVRGLTGEKETYPNLATVPPRPRDVPTTAQRAGDVTALEQERNRSRAAAKALEDAYKPLAVPPKPRVSAGRDGG